MKKPIKALFVLLFMVLIVSPDALAAEKKKKPEIMRVDNYIAVFDFEVTTGDKDIARPLTESVRREIVLSGKYKVIDRGNMEKILGEHKLQMSGCVTGECIVETGQLLGVGKLIGGTVSKVGNTYYLTLSLISVKTGQIEDIAEDKCRCEIDELLDSTKRLAKKLLSEKVEQPTTAAPKPLTVAESKAEAIARAEATAKAKAEEITRAKTEADELARQKALDAEREQLAAERRKFEERKKQIDEEQASLREEKEAKKEKTRGWMGISVQDVTEDIAKNLKLNQRGGAMISEVFKEGPGDKAGLRPGDVIIEVNGKGIKDTRALLFLLASFHVGEKFHVKVLQGGQERTYQGAMSKLPATPMVSEIGRDGSFIAYSNGTVSDTRTNLMWAAMDNGSDINWANAKNYCENYREGGYTDWRMPTQDELAELFDKSKTYRSDSGFNVHITELIRLTWTATLASETRGSEVAFFDFITGDRRWSPKSNAIFLRALPVRSAK